MFCSLFFLAWLSVNLGQASTPPIRWSILNSLGLLNIRGGAPDLSSGAKRDLWLGEDLSVGVRDGKFSVMTPKQKAELMIMGSTPTESRSILQVEYVRNVVVPSSHLTHLFRRTNVNQALDTLTPTTTRDLAAHPPLLRPSRNTSSSKTGRLQQRRCRRQLLPRRRRRRRKRFWRRAREVERAHYSARANSLSIASHRCPWRQRAGSIDSRLVPPQG